jgi:hypothetical protein
VPNGVELQLQVDSLRREIDGMQALWNRQKQELANAVTACAGRRRRR